MKKELRYTSAACGDLTQHLEYIAKQSESGARRWLDLVEAKCLLLRQFPEIGESMPRLGEGVRAAAVGRNIVFYRIVEDCVEILRVLGGERDTKFL